MDIPQWFSNFRIIQEPNNMSGDTLVFSMPQTVSIFYLGVVLWLNVGCTASHLSPSDFWALVKLTNRSKEWLCETSLWKKVSQSWVSFIPQAQFPLYANDIISVTVGHGPLQSIGVHVVYI